MEFYSDVRNLKRISPRFPRLQIEADDTRVISGRTFTLGLDFFAFKLFWNSTIDTVVPGEYFVDRFAGTIIREWKHTHAYKPVPSGTCLTDVVEFKPVWWCAPVVWLAVKFLFAYRKKALARVLG